MGEQDSVPTPAELTSPSRAPERRAKDDSSRRVVKSAQDLSDVSVDEVGIPLRVRMWSSLGFILNKCWQECGLECLGGGHSGLEGRDFVFDTSTNHTPVNISRLLQSRCRVLLSLMRKGTPGWSTVVELSCSRAANELGLPMFHRQDCHCEEPISNSCSRVKGIPSKVRLCNWVQEGDS